MPYPFVSLCGSLLILFSFCCFSATPVEFAKQYTYPSKIMAEEREYSVYLPPSYTQHSTQSYPVIYVLDGDQSKLLSISGVVQALSTEELENQIPQFIIVAIPNTNRSRDLTPTQTDLIYKGKELAKIPGSGGADKFLNFIQNELMPQIEKSYRTNQTKVLVGMSFGGLFTGHALLTRPEMFSHYLIADATYVWDDNYLNRIALGQIERLKQKRLSVYLALANNDHIGEHGVANRAWGNGFIARLNAIRSDNFHVYSDYFPKQRHGTVQMLAWYHGLVALFSAPSATASMKNDR
ncbi:alpha/beta hydrolase-fold protein [Aliiglaciecola sp. LCG003]|uniref:alpha/beta hydrolase n=1 Tax=Aliiglaciecola sp. LCG003 TaxID=3053655 RepID=UPI0025724A63|nr:alpha/beta hydrolase-fold protein [Aliiglaciecola sp. LCG003]WJG09048.1 alpha/beta hydrolase-fold protein [Aliiglaciecola sp. LCG003]